MNRPVGVDAQLDIQPGHAGLRRPRGLHLPAPGAAARQPADLVGRHARAGLRGGAAGSAAGTGASASRWSASRSTWLPWLMYDDRPIFLFYAVACLPFLVLGADPGARRASSARSDVPTPRRTAGVVVAGSYVVLAVLAFAWFWPIWTDQLLTHDEWLDRIWFTRWI